MSKLFSIILLIFILPGCSSDREKYLSAVNDPSNGLKKERVINGVKYTVKYLSPEFLARLEADREVETSKYSIDSLIKRYSDCLSFLLSVTPMDKTVDIMVKDISSYQEYSQRFQEMNFSLEKAVELKIGDNTYVPNLCVMENTYGLSEGRNLLIVFVPNTTEDTMFLKGEDLTITFEDYFFNGGINHFSFKRTDLTNYY